MLSSAKRTLLNRKVVALLLVVIIAVPFTIFAYSELNYGNYGNQPTHKMEAYSLEDMWYPSDGAWQPYPLFITANISSYYSRPFLMYPDHIEFDFLMKDTVNLTADLSWLSVSDYHIVPLGTYVNTTLTPKVSGDYGDNEGYIANQSESTVWHGTGLPLTSTSIGAGIQKRSFNMTGYWISHYYSFCRLGLSFGVDTSLRSIAWSLLLEIAINQQGASKIAGHWMEIIVWYTIYWVPILVFETFGGTNYSGSLPRGDGLSDEGMADFTFYMLEGDISLQLGHE
jgi:hypothetical protein